MLDTGEPLLIDAGAGQTITLTEVYQRYYNTVFHTCLRLIDNRTEAEDLTQDVFIQVQRHWRNFRGDSSIGAWLYRIAVNQVYMHWRKRSVRKEMVTLAGELPEDAKPVNSTGNSVTNEEQISLLRAIQLLPAGMREILILHDIYGYDHEEIGRRLGVHSGTSKSQLHKARLKVRELLRA